MKKKYLPSLLNKEVWKDRSKISEDWFKNLRNSFCEEFLKLENSYNNKKGYKNVFFKKKKWKKKN